MKSRGERGHPCRRPLVWRYAWGVRPLMMGLSCGKEYSYFIREIVEVEKFAPSRTVQSVP